MIKNIFLIGLLLFALFGCTEEVIEETKTVPRFDNVLIQSGSNAGSIQVSVSSPSQTANIYYIVTELEASLPTANQVIAGINYDENTVLKHGNTVNRLYVNILDFLEETTYMVHVVLEEDGIHSYVLSRKVLTKNEFEAGLFGSGTEEDPFQINSVWQLELIGTNEYGYTMEAHYIMTSDIDLKDGGYEKDVKSWVPIGKQNGLNRKFSGVFDGDGYTISNVYIESNAGTEKWGLFQETNVDSVVKNLHLDGVYVKVSGFRIAGLIGYAKGFVYNVSVMNAHIEQTAGEGQVGSIVGAFYDTGTLFRAESNATIIAVGRRVGGLVGAATTNSGFDTVRIYDSKFTGTVTGTDVTARQYGGILGAGTGVIVERVFSDATVSGVRQIGGIVGYVEGMGAITSIIRDSVFAGLHVNANGSDGNSTIAIGLVLGDASITKGPFEVINSFANEDATYTIVDSNSSRHNHGTKVSTASLMNLDFYQQQMNTWNFTNIWQISLSEFPSVKLTKK